MQIHKTESKDKPRPSSMQEFLDSYSKKSTRRMYRRGIELFCEWYGKDVDTILKERKDDLTPRPNESFVDAKQRASRYEKLIEKFHGLMPSNSKNHHICAKNACYQILVVIKVPKELK